MAVAPFNIVETVPGDDDVVSQFPAQNRTNMDIIEDWLNTEHDASGHHKIPVLDETARDAVTDWVVGSLVFNSDESQLEVVTADTPFVFSPAVSSAVSTGSWTPAIAFGGASVGVTYNTQVGTYVKIGTMVVAHARIVLSSNGSSTGDVTISGLPFASASTPTGMVWTAPVTGIGDEDPGMFLGDNTTLRLSTNSSAAELWIYFLDEDGEELVSVYFPMGDDDVGDNASFAFTIIYEAAS